MLDRFEPVHLPLAAHNAGLGAVERSGGVPHNGATPVLGTLPGAVLTYYQDGPSSDFEP